MTLFEFSHEVCGLVSFILISLGVLHHDVFVVFRIGIFSCSMSRYIEPNHETLNEAIQGTGLQIFGSYVEKAHQE
jgi:hypothetical protein